jgi:hypothetical protein
MTLSMQRSDHSGLTPQHIGDRFAIRELVDAYAHCADRRDVEGQMSLFTANTEFLWAPSRSGLLLARDRRANSLRVCREGNRCPLTLTRPFGPGSCARKAFSVASSAATRAKNGSSQKT